LIGSTAKNQLDPLSRFSTTHLLLDVLISEVVFRSA